MIISIYCDFFLKILTYIIYICNLCIFATYLTYLLYSRYLFNGNYLHLQITVHCCTCSLSDMSRYRIFKSSLIGRYFVTHPSRYRYRFFKTTPLTLELPLFIPASYCILTNLDFNITIIISVRLLSLS